MNTYVAVDVETGGFEGTSLLSVYLAALDENLNVVGTCEMNVKPDDAIYRVTADGLAVNKIDLVEHEKTALTYSSAGAFLRKFLVAMSQRGEIKLVPVGHGVTGDMIALRAILSRSNLEQYTSYRKLDTAVIAQYLKFVGSLPESISGSLESLCEHFNIFCSTPAHTAKGDVARTIAVLRAMRRLSKGEI